MDAFAALRELFAIPNRPSKSTRRPLFVSEEETGDLIHEESVGFLSDESSPHDCNDTEGHVYLSEKPVSMQRSFSMLDFASKLLWTYVKEVLLFLLPSFISSRIDAKRAQNSPLRSTAYLDGLRGLAAWAVFNGHLTTVYCKDCDAGWGHDGQNYQLWRFPIVVLIFRGDFSVALFFLISGFALSVGAIAEMRRSPRDPAKFLQKLSSSIFRRPTRLLLPAIASMILSFVLIRLHYLQYVQEHIYLYNELVQGWEPISVDKPQTFDTFYGQLGDLIACIGDLFQILTEPVHQSYHLPYNAVLWTVKLEFRCSLLLFLVHAAVYYLRFLQRVAILIMLIVLTIAVGSFDMPGFLIGYLFAELNYHWESQPSQRRKINTILWLSFFIVGSWLGSCTPWQGTNTPFYRWQWAMAPQTWQASRFWNIIGASICFFAITRSSLLQKIYTCSLVQYLGRISFAMYLVHFYIVQGVGEMLFYYTWKYTGKESMVMEALGFAFVYVAVLSIVVWVADIFFRVADAPCIKLGYILQKRLFTEQ